MNAIKPGTVTKINKLKMPFMHMENINFFLKGCESMGVPVYDLFHTADLYEGKNIRQVVLCIHSLGRAVTSKPPPGFNGPYLGAKLATQNRRTFTEEQLRRGSVELTFVQANALQQQTLASGARRTVLDSVKRI